MEKQKQIEAFLSCVLCNQKFNKTNKPLIMFCGHNICEDCRLNNNKKIKCVTCGKVFSKREIKKFPINYSILENKLVSPSEKNDNTLKEDDKNTDEKNLELVQNLSQETCLNIMSSFMAEINKYMTEKQNIEQLNKENESNNNINDNDNNEDNKINEEKKNIESQCDEIIKERDLIIKDTFDLIKNLEKGFLSYSKIFFDSMIDLIKTNSEFLINDLNISQLLQESGVINYGDYIKLENFLDIMKEIDEDKLRECASFEEIYQLIKEKRKDVSYDKFISLFFFFNKIIELKIKKMPKIFEEQRKLCSHKKDNQANLIHLLTNLAQKYEMKLSDVFYDITIYKTGHFIYDINKNKNIKESLNKFCTINEESFKDYNNVLLLYEPIQKNLNIIIIKIKELKDEEIIDSYLILNQLLYILTDKKLYIYELTTEKYTSINTIQNQEIEKNTKIFKFDTSIMKISSNYFESINLRKDISKNEWRTMSLFENTPGIIKSPLPVCHSSDYIYVLDGENKDINFIYSYNDELDLWEKKEIKLEIKQEEENINKEIDSNDNKDNKNEEIVIIKKLYLEDYFFFNKCFACIFGGRHPVTKKFNKNVYTIDPIKGIIKKIINFDDYISDEMNILNLNVGILNKYVDFIFIYHLINQENIIKIKIIRKEIIENDISIKSKLQIIMDINISDIIV